MKLPHPLCVPLCALTLFVAPRIIAAPAVKSAASVTATQSPFARPLAGDKAFNHVLNRLSFGPRPGDLEAIKRIGLKPWIETQLSPQKIDDAALETRLEGLTWLGETPEKLQLAYESDKAGFIRKMKKAQTGEIAATPLTAKQEEVLARITAAEIPERASIQALGELSTDKLARAIESNRQLQEVLVDFWGNHFNVDVKKGAVRAYKIVDDRAVIRPNVFGNFRTMLGASAHSPAMLIYLDNARSTKEMSAATAVKGGALKARRAARMAALKMPNTRANAGADANANANAMAPMMNAGEDAAPQIVPQAAPQVVPPAGKPRGGINENYARELMELHTLGVDGGYTQHDVTEVARCFTGWSVDPQTGEFIFRARAHDEGEKEVLGQKINAGGEADGEAVLDLLAKSPATAQFISRQLCQRFVADEPPQTLVDKVAHAFTISNGDLPTTYRALFYAPEFGSEGAYRAKIKSPLEFTVSAVRALGGTLDFGEGMGARLRLMAVGGSSLKDGAAPKGAAAKAMKRPLVSEIAAMGQPLFSCQAPTGYPEKSSSWVSSSALVARLNFALSLTSGRIGDVVLAQDTFRSAPVDALATSLLGSDLSASTRATVEAEAKTAPEDGARLRALLIGSPDFQRR